MPYTLPNVFHEAWNWGKGPFDATERAAAIAICDRATSRSEAVHLLAMCGLLRKDNP